MVTFSPEALESRDASSLKVVFKAAIEELNPVRLMTPATPGRDSLTLRPRREGACEPVRAITVPVKPESMRSGIDLAASTRASKDASLAFDPAP